jgi:hypothetical protein
MLWYHEAPWRPQPDDALLELQSQFLRENYDLASMLQEHLHSAREAVRITESEGDAYGILDFYREQLACLERLAQSPQPEEPKKQIEFVREVWKWSGQGIGNVLDVTGASGQNEMDAQVLGSDDVEKFCGTDRPTRDQASAAISRINETLGRGQSVCFAFYDSECKPIGWYFVGNTID